MKTETQIAKENVESFHVYRFSQREMYDSGYWKGMCVSHLASLKRELDFIEFIAFCPEGAKCCKKIAVERYNDIKKAIKVYKDGGIE